MILNNHIINTLSRSKVIQFTIDEINSELEELKREYREASSKDKAKIKVLIKELTAFKLRYLKLCSNSR